MPTLTWVGKDKVVNHHLDVPFRVLNKECHFQAPEGTPANSSDNRIIHGDNLAALKSLLPEFEGKINCIYIDPPYNTGNESWVYNDAVNDPKIKKWLGQVVGKEGEDLSRHDKWLCMMYPRLKLLHRLLAQDGVIFISIDDNEQAHLRLVCDEIFGSGNFINNVIWEKKFNPQNDAKYFSDNHDFIVTYAKNKTLWNRNFLPRTDTQNDRYKNIDNDPRGAWASDNFTVKTYSKDYDYEITTPSGRKVSPTDGRCWATSEENFNALVQENRIWFGQKGDGVPRLKRFLSEVQEGIVPLTIWKHTEVGNNQDSKQILKKIFPESKTPFETPKPPSLIERILQIATNKDSIILDSFAGSGTTAHAVLKLNAQDGGNRRFILIEMEDYADTITAERVRRVMTGYGEGTKQTTGLGGSFDYYTVGDAIFLADENLNEAVGIDVIRDYVSYSERIPTENRTTQNNPYTPHLLGLSTETAWIFYYEADAITCLDMEFLGKLKFGSKKPTTAIIYADKSLLTKEFMSKHGIIFKKIPRDITRF